MEQFYELSEVEQELQIAAWETDQERCRCGNPRSECADPKRRWYPQRQICYAEVEQKASEWRYDELHKARPFHDGTFSNWSAERDQEHPCHYLDGVTIYTAAVDLNPNDKFLSPFAGLTTDDEETGGE